MNAAIAATGGDAVLLLNADCVAAPGFVAALADRLASDDDYGSVAPKLLRATGLEEADRLDEIDAAGISVSRWAKNRLVGHGEPGSAYASPGEVFAGDGAAVLCRRARSRTSRSARRSSTRTWPCGRPSRPGWRAQLRGWRCAYEPAAVAWHVRTYRPAVPRDALAAEHRRMQFRNRLLMLAKDATPTVVALAPVLAYEAAALGHALLRERELLGAYRDAWALRDGARRRRAVIQRRRTVRRPPFGLRPSP